MIMHVLKAVFALLVTIPAGFIWLVLVKEIKEKAEKKK